MVDTLVLASNDFIVMLQHSLAGLIPVMQFFSFLGQEEFYLLVMPLLVWTVDYNLGVRLGVMLNISNTLTNLVKYSFHKPRPYWVDQDIQGLSAGESGFGAPSGHAANAMSLYGLLAASIKKKWAIYAAAFFIFFIGFSRPFLGMHSVFDIVLGWTLGGVILILFLRWEPAVMAWFGKMQLSAKILNLLGISLALILAGAVILQSTSDFNIPQVWKANALAAYPAEPIDPTNLNSVITTAAGLFGLGAGAFWLASKGGFHTPGTYLQYFLRFVIGIIGVLVFWKGLGAVFPSSQDILGFSLRFLRYTLVAFWISGLGPFVFKKLGLAAVETA